MCPAMSLSFPPLPFSPHLKSNTKLSLFPNSGSRFSSLTCHYGGTGAPMGDEKNAFYVVKKGSVIGIYKSFTQIQPLLSSSDSGEPFSVYKGFSLPQEAEKYLVSHALEGATYSISAANIKAGSLGKLDLCHYQGEDEPSSVSTYLQPAFLSPNRCYSCTIEFDGASTQNSERAGAGAILYANDDSKVHRFREGVGCNPRYVAVYTKYIAEYRALILGLKHALKKGYEDISIVRDASKSYDFPNMSDNIKMELCIEVKKLKKKFQSVKTIICPEYNNEATIEANRAIYLEDGQVEEDCETNNEKLAAYKALPWKSICVNL